jgi:hypothetical protein
MGNVHKEDEFKTKYRERQEFRQEEVNSLEGNVLRIGHLPVCCSEYKNIY